MYFMYIIPVYRVLVFDVNKARLFISLEGMREREKEKYMSTIDQGEITQCENCCQNKSIHPDSVSS